MNYHPNTAQINVQGCIVLTHSAVYVGRNLWICAIHGSIGPTLRGNPWIAQESVDRTARSINFAYDTIVGADIYGPIGNLY